MPNWCSNTVTISHEDSNKLNALFEQIDTKGEFFNYVLPIDLTNAYYDALEKWGTKWEPDVEEVEYIEGEVNFYMNTAWSPPIGVYEELKRQGFVVMATYYEPGMCFVGKWEDGSDEYYEYDDLTSDNIRDFIPDDLVDDYCLDEFLAEAEEENA